MTSWKENLCALLNDVELADTSTYDSCLSKKLEFISQYPERYSIFALDEKASQILLLTKDGFTNESSHAFHKRTLILTPMPTLRISSLLLAADGRFMAILTRTSVHVFDARYRLSQESEDSTPIIKRIYCAFDCMDHISPDKSRVELLRVRWHPRLSGTLVVLTTDSRIFFIECSKLPGSNGVGCRLRFHMDLGDFKRRMADVTAYSDTENATRDSGHEDSEDDSQNTSRSYSRLDLENALGGGCVDFDFGAPVTRHSAKCRFEKDQALDCCVYLLCESGDIVQLSGCLTADRNPTNLSIRTLHILPPSVDNYGDDFCALLAFTPAYHPDSVDCDIPTEIPPDILVMANRSGLLYQGVVLQSTGRSSKHADANLDGPALCLVDVVDLHLHNATEHIVCNTTEQQDEEGTSFSQRSHSYMQAGSVRSESPGPRVFEESVSLVLEPARLVRSLETDSVLHGWPFHMAVPSGSYPYLAYYVIHDAGLHMVRLPWLQYVDQWCRKLAEDPLIGTGTTENITLGKVRDWHSSVKHLICAQLPLDSTTSIAGSTMPGGFHVSGLIEVPLDPTLFRDDKNIPNHTGQNKSSGTLLVVRAPHRPLSTSGSSSSTITVSSLVIPVPIEPIRGVLARCTGDDTLVKREPSTGITQSDNSNVHKDTEVQQKPPTNRSEFAVHLRRLLNPDASTLPRITGLSLQSNLTQMQLVQFFLKATEILRSGPLQRLIRARTFVEQYTSRLADHLSAQHTEAMKLTAVRQELQQHAEQLTKQHATVLERQQQLDKRLAALASRLAGLCDSPTKIDVAMHDEVVAVRDRLRKGLQKWLSSLRARHAVLDERLTRFGKSPRVPSSVATVTETGLIDEELELKRVSCAVRQETIEIKQLVDTIKLLNTKTNPFAV